MDNEPKAAVEEQANIPSAGREKYWEEMNADEKVQNMRVEMDGMRARMNSMENLLRAVLNHSHNTGGEIVIPYHFYEQSQHEITYVKQELSWVEDRNKKLRAEIMKSKEQNEQTRPA